jgi:hypothetical protein
MSRHKGVAPGHRVWDKQVSTKQEHTMKRFDKYANTIDAAALADFATITAYFNKNGYIVLGIAADESLYVVRVKCVERGRGTYDELVEINDHGEFAILDEVEI